MSLLFFLILKDGYFHISPFPDSPATAAAAVVVIVDASVGDGFAAEKSIIMKLKRV